MAFSSKYPARPLLVEGVQRRGDPGAAGPIRHVRRTGRERFVRYRACAARARKALVGRGRLNRNVLTRFPCISEIMQEMQKDVAVPGHRAGNIEQRHDRRRSVFGPMKRRSRKSPPPGKLARKVRRMSIRWPRGCCGASRPGAYFGERQHQPLHRTLGGGDLGAGHLRRNIFFQISRSDTSRCGCRARSRALS